MKKVKAVKRKAENPDLTNYLIGALVVLLLVVLYFNFFGKPATVVPPSMNLEDDDPALGPKDAKAVIVEFSDFQCPACKAAEPTVKQVLKDFGDKVRLVYRDFPLDQGCNPLLESQIHPYACRAAFAADCANEQGKFWVYHDKLFEMSPALSDDALKKYAVDVGLDSSKFNACLDSLKYLDEVKKDIADATSLGLQGTPSFFVNGVPLSGRSYDDFKSAIESAK